MTERDDGQFSSDGEPASCLPEVVGICTLLGSIVAIGVGYYIYLDGHPKGEMLMAVGIAGVTMSIGYFMYLGGLKEEDS